MNRAFTLLEVVVVFVVLLILAALLFPVFVRSGDHTPRASICRSHLKQIGIGFAQYVQDYNERFPPARVTPTTGWTDAIYPYIKSTKVFQCPTAPNSTEPLIDYFYNRRLSLLKIEKVDSVNQTLLGGDGSDDAPTWNAVLQLPTAWKTTPTSPSIRHLDAANYVFVDGHVKSLPPSKITTASPHTKPYPYTFAIR